MQKGTLDLFGFERPSPAGWLPRFLMEHSADALPAEARRSVVWWEPQLVSAFQEYIDVPPRLVTVGLPTRINDFWTSRRHCVVDRAACAIEN